MEALTWRRARALDPRDDRVHLGADSPRGLRESLCGVAISSTDAEPTVSPTCFVCRRIVER